MEPAALAHGLVHDPLIEAIRNKEILEREEARAKIELDRTRAALVKLQGALQVKHALWAAKNAELAAKEEEVYNLQHQRSNGQGHEWHADPYLKPSLSGIRYLCECGAIRQGDTYLKAGRGHHLAGGGAAAAADPAPEGAGSFLRPGQRKWGFQF